MKITIFLVLFLAFSLTMAEIHRARPGNNFRRSKNRLIQQQPQAHSNSSFSRWLDGEFLGHKNAIWFYSSISACLVGLSGLFPLLVIPFGAADVLKNGGSTKSLRLLLSYAVGGLLGDVFLHLLPEAWSHIHNFENAKVGHRNISLWILAGMLSFLFIEKMFPDDDEDGDEDEDKEEKEEGNSICSDFKSTEMLLSKNREHLIQDGLAKLKNVLSNNCLTPNDKVPSKVSSKVSPKVSSKDLATPMSKPAKMDSPEFSSRKILSHGLLNSKMDLKGQNSSESVCSVTSNGSTLTNGKQPSATAQWAKPAKKAHIKISGWLNLVANVVDNFTHGLAVAGSYCISTKMGMLTTFAILLHEIPHEIGDFAILLRSGFDRWAAARAQFLTAFGGIIGALLALSAESTKIAGDSTAWILPFTAGGFINIALVTVMPDILKEDKPWESVKQMCMICVGILTMASITVIFD